MEKLIAKNLLEAVRKKTIADGTFTRAGKYLQRTRGFYCGGFQKLEGVKQIDAQNLDRLTFKKNELFGAWTDKKTDILWLDKVRWFYKKSKALEWAEKLQELAVWDCEAREEIRL
jgi:hypothetical protein